MWLPSVLLILTLTLHTTTHAERVERFRNGEFCCSREIELQMLLKTLTEYHADYTLNIKLKLNTMSMQSYEFSLALLERNTMLCFLNCCSVSQSTRVELYVTLDFYITKCKVMYQSSLRVGCKINSIAIGQVLVAYDIDIIYKP